MIDWLMYWFPPKPVLAAALIIYAIYLTNKLEFTPKDFDQDINLK